MRWPENINLYIDLKVHRKLSEFYHNMWKARHDEWGREEINKLISSRYDSLIKNVNQNKLLMQPYLNKWNDYKRIVIDEWNYAVDIKNEKVFIVDACHAQNMHNIKNLIDLFEKDLQGYSETIKNLTLPHIPGNPYFMRVELNDCCFYMKEITEDNYFKCKDDTNFAYKLAEDVFKNEIQYIEQSKELLESRGFKL